MSLEKPFIKKDGIIKTEKFEPTLSVRIGAETHAGKIAYPGEFKNNQRSISEYPTHFTVIELADGSKFSVENNTIRFGTHEEKTMANINIGTAIENYLLDVCHIGLIGKELEQLGHFLTNLPNEEAELMLVVGRNSNYVKLKYNPGSKTIELLSSYDMTSENGIDIIGNQPKKMVWQVV